MTAGMTAFVYILACSDRGRYTGSTTNLRRRLRQHGEGQVRSTKGRLGTYQWLPRTSPGLRA